MAIFDQIEANFRNLSEYNAYVVNTAIYIVLLVIFMSYALLKAVFSPQFNLDNLFYGIFIDSTVCAGLVMCMWQLLSKTFKSLQFPGWADTFDAAGETGLAVSVAFILFYFLPFDIISPAIFANPLFIINLPGIILKFFLYFLISYIILRLSLLFDHRVEGSRDWKIFAVTAITLIIVFVERISSYGLSLTGFLFGVGFSLLPPIRIILIPFVIATLIMFIYNRLNQA